MSNGNVTPTPAARSPSAAGGIAGTASAPVSPAGAASMGQGHVKRRYVGKFLLLEWEEELPANLLLRVRIKRGYIFDRFLQNTEVAVRRDFAHLLPRLEEVVTDEDLEDVEIYSRVLAIVNSETVDYARRATFEGGEEEEVVEVEVRER